MSFKGLPYRHYMDDSMEVADKTVLYYCRCYFRASPTAEPLYDTVHSFSVQGLADNAYVYDRRYAADPFVLYPWLSDSFREAHGIGPIGYIAVEDTYSSRETADGADIIDGALAMLKTVQGKTVASKNLIPFPYYEGPSHTEYGVTFTVNTDGSITVNGTSTGNAQLILVKANTLWNQTGTFTISAAGTDDVSIQLVTGGGNSGVPFSSGTRTQTFSGNMNWGHILIQVSAGQTANNVRVYPMLNEGSSALPYIPHFSGLKNAYFQGLRSTGRNLIPFPYYDDTKTVNGVTFTVNDDGSVTVNGTATSQTNFYFVSSSNPILAFPIGTVLSLAGCPSGGNGRTFFLNLLSVDYTEGITEIGNGGTLTTTKKSYYLYFRMVQGVTLTNAVIRPMLNYGSSALPYEPYISNEISLDTAIELPAWDSINPITGKRIVQSNTLTFNGTESWSLSPNDNYYIFSYLLPVLGENAGGPAGYICNILPVEFPISGAQGTYMSGDTYRRNLHCFFLKTAYPDLSTVDAWKAQLAAWNTAGDPLTVCYQTATATESDIEMEDRLPAYKNGSETVIQGDTDNSEYGAENTLTQEYYNLEVNDDE